MTSLEEIVNKKQVLFITTKNLDYLRNSQEIALLKNAGAAKVDIIGSNRSSYPRRLLYVYLRLLLCSAKKYDVIFVGFSPQLIVPFWRFKFRRNTLVEDFFISLFDTLVCDRQKFGATSLRGRFFHWLDQATLRGAHLVICDTRAHGDYFNREFAKTPLPLMPLYLEADTSIYYPRPSSREDKDLHVLYFGSILPLQGLQVLFDAMQILLDHPGIRFTIIGPIPEHMQPPVSDRIRYIKWLSQEKLAAQIAAADLCIAGHFHPTIAKASRTIPGKAYIYEAMNKPMILGDNPATRERDGKWKVPVSYVPMGDPKALADCIASYQKAD